MPKDEDVLQLVSVSMTFCCFSSSPCSLPSHSYLLTLTVIEELLFLSLQ